MRRIAKTVLLGSLLILGVVVALRGAALLVPSGSWVPEGMMASARSSAAAALLPDGRILITGGDSGSGPVASADFINVDGTISAAPPMIYARSKHFALALQDGRILVAGGITAGGSSTSSAEIFDPVANSWTNAGAGMTEARASATAVVLQDGRVLIAGGQNGTSISSTIEIFDPTLGTFTPAGMMSSPRTQHAMAALQNGRVIIVGGNNGTAPVASTDIFDPVAGTVSAGPSLAIARFGHSATTLLNGQVAVIGGNNGNAIQSQMDVTPAEIFDPTAATPAFTTLAANLATPREGHLALLLPNNNSVLIAGGTSAGTTVASAELFTAQGAPPSAWTYSFGSTEAMNVPRSSAGGSANQINATSSLMQRNGVVMVGGGADASGNPLNTTEAYGYATVQTDQGDYAPGSRVTITGSGWQPGETVTLSFLESPYYDTHPSLTAVADANGNIVNTQFSPDVHDIDIRFYLTASGGTSGFQAQNTFTDGGVNKITSVTAQNPSPVPAGASATYSVTVSFNGNSNSCTATLSTSTLPTGASASFAPIPSGNPANTITSTGADVTTTLTVSTTLGMTPVTTTFTITATPTSGGGCSGGAASTNANGSGGSAQNPTLAVSAPPSTAVNFASSNPAGMNGATLSVTAIGYTQPNGTAGNTAYSFTAPGPAASLNNIQTEPSTIVNFAFPTAVTFNSAQYTLTAIKCNGGSCTSANVSSGTGSFTDGAAGTTQTVTGTYVAQYQVTFKQSGIGGDTNSTVVTYSGTEAGVSVAPTNLTASQLPFSAFFDAGTTVSYTYASPVASTTTGKQYVLSQTVSPNPSPASPINSAQTVTGTYVPQWQVTFAQSGIPGTDIAGTSTVVTVNGTPQTYAALPYSAYFDSGSAVSYSYATPVASSNTGEQFVLTSTSPVSIGSLSTATTVTGTYKVQYQVTFAQSGIPAADIAAATAVVTVNGTPQAYSTLPYSAYFDKNSAVSYSYATPVASSNTGEQFVLTSTSPVSIGSLSTATTVTGTYKVQYQVTFAQSGIPAADIAAATAVVTVNGTPQAYSTLPYSAYFDKNSAVSYSYATPVASSNTGEQFVLTSTSPVSIGSLSTATTVTGTYKVQYQVTFAQSGIPAADIAAATAVVTVNGTPQAYSTLPYSAYFDKNSAVSYSYATPVASSNTGEQFVLTSTSPVSIGSLSTATTVTGTYKVQYQVTFAQSGMTGDQTGTIVTVNGSPQSTLPYSAYFDATSMVTYAYTSPVTTSVSGKQYVLTAPAASPVSPITVGAAATVTGTYKAQFQITFAQSGMTGDQTGTIVTVNGSPQSTLPYSAYFDATSMVTYAYTSPVTTSASGKQYVLTTPAPSPVSPITVGAAATVTGTYKAQFQVTFAQSGMTGDQTGTIVTVNGSPQSILSYSTYFDAGSTVNYTYSNPVSTSVSGKRYIITAPAASPTTGFTLSATMTVTATYKAQFDTATGTASSLNPSIFGQLVTFTATVSTIASGGPTPTGSLTFAIDGGTPQPGTSFTSGCPAFSLCASYAIGSLMVNGSPHSVSAAYINADDSFTSSVGALAGGQTVQTASTSTAVSSSQNPSTFGQPVNFTATVSNASGTGVTPTGSVQFIVDGLNSGSPVALTGGTAMSAPTSTLAASGSPHTVTANYVNSDGNFSNSNGTLAGGQAVQKANTSTAVSSSQNPSTFGQSVTFTATVSNASGTGVTPTGSVQFVVDGSNLGSAVVLTGGSATSSAISTLIVNGSPHTVTANYVNSDGNFSNSNGTLAGGQAVQKASTSTAVSSSQNPSTFGRSITFMATVSNASGTGVTPTGSVQFIVDGLNSGSPVALTGGAATSAPTSALTASGSPHTVTANYVNSDGNFSNGNGTLAGGQTVQKANTSTAVSSSQNPSTFGQSVTFTATVMNTAGAGVSTATPTGTVQFVVDGSNFGSPVPVTGSGATATAASMSTSTLSVGPHTVVAVYTNADGNFVGSMSSTLTQQVNFGFVGFGPPYAPPPTTFNVTRTMPLKWQYTNSSGAVVNSAAANPAIVINGPYPCGTSDTSSTITVNDAGASGYQYDPGSNSWQFNWQIKGNAVGCYDISVKSQQSGQTNGAFPISVVNK